MVGWLLGVCAAAGLYGFLIAPRFPRSLRRMGPLLNVDYAHRGLHGSDVPENSLPAFRRAAQAGYGIELDVHLTRDGVLAVHHDASLLRTCGVDKRIPDMTLQEVQACFLEGTDDTVPTLRAVLDTVAPYKTPLIVEMKSDRESRRQLPPLLLRELADYPGPWCVESFDGRMLRWFRRHAPNAVRGQLAFDPARKGEHRGQVGYKLLAHLLTNFLSRPDFVAYDHETDKNPTFRLVKRLFRPWLAAWTVKTPQDMERLRGTYDLLIFEGFLPSCTRRMSQYDIEKETPS